MLSKRAGSFLVLLPVLGFAQLSLSHSSPQATHEGSVPQVGLRASLPLPQFGPFDPRGQMRPPFAPETKLSMKHGLSHPKLPWGDHNSIFLTAPTYGSGGYYAESVAVADVNGDGNPDLVVPNQCADSACMRRGLVGVLLGQGDGTFKSVVKYDSGGYGAFSVAVADVNGDGKPDLVVANVCANSNCTSGGSVAALLGNGDGTFKAAMSYPSGGEDAYS